MRLLALVMALAGLTVLGTPAAPAVSAAPAGSVVLGGTIQTIGDGPVDATVTLYRWQPEGASFVWADDLTVAADTGPVSYAFTVPVGLYVVEVAETSGAYLTTYSGGGTEPPVDLVSAAVVTVAGVARIVDIRLVPAPVARRVSGTVVDRAGAPLADLYVEASAVGDADGSGGSGGSGTASTGADGSFDLLLLPGDYRLRVWGDDEVEGIERDLVVGEADQVLEPLVLAPAGHWRVSGRVLDADGPVADATVDLLRLDADGDERWVDGWVDQVTTAADGRYVFEGVRSGAEYTVEADAEGHLPRYAGGVADVTEAGLATVRLTADHTFGDLVLPRASALRGTVTGPAGPEAEVAVTLYRWDDDAGWYDADAATTDAQGRYRIPTLRPGRHTLRFDPPHTSTAAGSWLSGALMPEGPDAAGVLTVGDTAAEIVADRRLERAPVATGRVVDSSGQPVAGGSVAGYRWSAEDEAWEPDGTASTGADGRFALRLPDPGETITLRFGRAGLGARFLDGGTTLPASPVGSGVRVVGTGDLALPDVLLGPLTSALGAVAGQRELAHCRAHALPAADEASAEVAVPFPLALGGAVHDRLFVNTNGSVSLGEPLAQATPGALTGPLDVPVIAPFLADVDTSATGSDVVTYGAAPDGRSFCVTWADVGYYDGHDDRLNTFQLLLTARGDGDFDVRFNYDRIAWESGDASGGTGGRGGTTAVAGVSSGTGLPGSFVQLPGSLTRGALLDGGPRSLVAGGNQRPGRYDFEVRGGAVALAGSVPGPTPDPDPDPDPDGDPEPPPGQQPKPDPKPDATAPRATTTSLSAPRKLAPRRRATVAVRVTAPGAAPAGSVVVRDGARVVGRGTLAGGEVRIRLKRLAPGRHALVATYAGSAVWSTSVSVPVKVKVRRR